MGFRVKDVRIDKQKVLAITDGPKYAEYAKSRAERLVDLAVAVFEAAETEPGHRKSENSPPVYVQSFEIRKIGRRWRVVNTDPGANLVEFGAHPRGGPTPTLRYAPMRKALDLLEAEGRL